MRLTVKPLQPGGTATLLPTMTSIHVKPPCITVTQPTSLLPEKLSMEDPRQVAKRWEGLVSPFDDHYHNLSSSMSRFELRPDKLNKRWMEYQGITDWDGLLDPLDENLRAEILRYGKFVDAAYKAFEFDSSSPSYATCQFPKTKFFNRCGLPYTKYKVTKNLRATSGIQLPRWIEKAPSWVATRSSWIGYVAAIGALGRHLEKQGIKILRIVNSDDLITKVPGFVIDEDDVSKNRNVHLSGLPSWIQKLVEDTQWVYSDVGRELRLSSRDSPYLNEFNLATCHELKTYLHLVEGFVSSTCPFRATPKRFLQR
ncbi:Phospholipase A1 [Quillaja saponaria]|uniref:Phospholipase A1 n=1 Tax=Quillaja saponaria TaxID=32244 RepID=A0AAD7L3V1_QUISA|nr:Phospholipase A1 [Quillaja saponaria]